MAFAQTTEMVLPNGNNVTVCATHEQVVCRKCCVDFSFDLNDGECISSDDEGIFGFDSDSPVPRDVTFTQVANSKFGRQRSTEQRTASTQITSFTRGFNVCIPFPQSENLVPYSRSRTTPSGNVFPALFFHPKMATMQPHDLFPPGYCRFYNRYNPSEILVYTDGACSHNGTRDASGGCGFVFKSTEGGPVGLKLEDRGTDGKVYHQTSNRAELRAALAALRYRAWYGEGVKSIVIATDSTYVAHGATSWARNWLSEGWRLSSGELVKNRDLWEALLLEVEKLNDRGCGVSFWNIPRKWNIEADRIAKEASTTYKRQEGFMDIFGYIV